MKMRSRLTALLLAVLMFISTAAPALAADALPLSVYQSMVDSAAADQTVSEPVITLGGEVYDLGESAQPAASGYDSTSEITLAAGEGEQAVALPVNGKVLLTADIADGQWQVQVGDQWVNMHGETASTVEVTYAKVQSLFVMNNAAKLRFISADGSAVSCVANIGLDYSVQTLEEDVTMPMMYNARTLNANAGVALADLDELAEPEKVYIEIAYRFENGEEAATSYIAELPYDDDLTTSVLQLPEVEGYLATLGVPGEPAYLESEVIFVQPTASVNGTIQLTLKNVQVDRTFVVTYVPTFVEYAVEHLQMGEDAQFDTAVLKDTVVKNDRKTGEAVGPGLAMPTAQGYAYEGFTALWYDENTTVAANSSTVIRVYYERNWYLMLFDLDGGFGVDPIYAQYGVAINPGTPTKAGYTFKGWSTSADGDLVTLPTTMPCLDATDSRITYYAQWTENETAPVTIVFWGEAANSEEYEYLGSGTVNATVDEQFTYSSNIDLDYTCGLEEHTHTSSCTYACGKTEHESHSAYDGDCYTLTCTITPHTHGKGCYANVGNASGTGSLGKPSSPAEGQVYKGRLGTYIYINGTWYDYTGTTSSGSIAPTTCGKQANSHNHTAACYTFSCTTELHAHSEQCRSCGKPEHKHSDECASPDSAQNAYLWTLVKSETVTVAEDGSSIVNVYFDRKEFTLHFRAKYSSTDNYGTITDKWGADISAEYIAVTEKAGGTFWSGTQDGDSPYTNYIGVMPKNNAIYYYGDVSGNTGSMTYYGESQTSGDYSVKLFEVENVGGYTVTIEDRYEFEGFTYHHGSDIGDSCGGANFYYTRNTYTLDFNDGYSNVRSERVKYEATLEPYATFVPELPMQVEPNSVKFDGWYLNPECTGDEYDLSTHNMPASDLILYAKWVPTHHNVTFYMDEDAYVAGTILPETTTTSVLHGAFLPDTAVPDTEKLEEDNDPYDFIGWFYQDEKGDEWAFDPANMTVRRDLQVYGKWTVNEPINFIIYYREADADGNALKDENGNYIDVGAPTEGYALYGSTITIAAKTGTDLYAPYREGYFPHPPSHSVKLEIVNDESGEKVNTFEFLYTKAETVPYKVMYVTKNADGSYTRLLDDHLVDKDQTKTIVTENYKHIPGYMPDAYQKRLIVMFGGTTDDDGDFISEAGLGENLIIFYYTKSAEEAIWTTTHYTEPIDGTTDINQWEQYGDVVSQKGSINQTYTAEVLDIPGFTYNKGVLVTYTINQNGNVTTSDPLDVTNDLTHGLPNGGMEYKLYYTRNDYPVLIRYIDQDTGKPIIAEHLYTDANGVSAFPYQSTVKVTIDETNSAFAGYKMVSQNPQKIQSVQVDGDGSEGKPITRNVLTFYFIEPEADVDYVVVGTEGCGTVAVNDQDETTLPGTKVREDVKIKTGTAKGATAVSSDEQLFTFKGWYSDKDCTQLLTEDSSYVPSKPENSDWPDALIFYALFEEVPASVTYEVDGPAGCGTVNLKDDIDTTVPGESVNEQFGRVTGIAVGAVADPSSKVFKFVGWYNADNELVSNELEYVPQQPSHVNAETGETVLDPWPVTSVYYAKFEYNLTSLTIVKKGVNTTKDPGVSFVFNVDGKSEGDDTNLDVAINQNGSVTIYGLTVGNKYDVTEKLGNWRYSATDTDQEITLVADANENVVTFENVRGSDKWLDGDCYAENKFN